MKRKLFDCFIFNDEFDILEIRVNTVPADYFFIVIGSHTFQGQEFTAEELGSKISTIHEVMMIAGKKMMVDYEIHLCNLNATLGNWDREHEQREALKRALDIKGCDDDLFIFSDADEIPKIDWPISYKEYPVTLFMPIHYFGLNYRTKLQYGYPVIVTRSEMEEKAYSIKFLRDNREKFHFIYDAGWHFTWLGGCEGIRKKVTTYSHAELNTPNILTNTNLSMCIEKKMIPDGTQLDLEKIEIDNSFPPYLVQHIDKFQKYILP